MASFIVELLVVVEADKPTDAEALGERAAAMAARARRHSTGAAHIERVIVSDVRGDDDTTFDAADAVWSPARQ